MPGARKITIDSVPQGATIIATGREVGKTPLTVNPDDIFPPHWRGGSYLVSGQLKLTKPGCDSHLMEVNDPVLSKNIKIRLKCDPSYSAPVQPVQRVQPASRIQPVSTPKPVKQEYPATIESRLDRIDALLKKGKISKEEYQEIRRRILDSL
jgi:hypothetical protein